MIRGPEAAYAEPWSRSELLRETRAGETYTAATEPKADKADLARQKVEEGIASLAASLQAGNSEALTAYLKTMSRFHRYSLGNTILIAFQNPEATHVAGFHAWKSIGRSVKKGEKGIMILAPIPKRFKAGEGEGSNGNSDAREQTETKETTAASGVWGFKVVYVFDVSQTEGKELPQFATVQGDPAEKRDRLKALIQSEGIGLSYSDRLGGAFGVSHKGRIEVLSGLTPAHEFSVLVHELAHELLHRDLKRRAETDKTVRETEAEAIAYVVCQAIGLDTGSQHADYIKLYRGSVETLTASLTAIQETATRILSAVQDEPGKR